MRLAPGTRLGHYDVTALIGEGGMGQVWQATDTQLNRQVALKILPDAFAADPERLARFTREAQILASLNHPNIAAIHGIEEDAVEGRRALVLELVEGPTLADRIAQGPIPLDEALPIAKQIAEALEAAHEAGVIHRDLKPANIKVREDGAVKVLDFGLAKALDPTPNADPSQSPTLTAAATQMGVIMGTAAYMSPEQARGKVVDKRADIWAFGVVLYEMLTGARPFQGEDVSLTLASVMKSDINVTVFPANLPETLRTVIRQCLQKDPKRRIRDIGDVQLAMEGTFETATAAPSSEATARQPDWWRQALPWVASLALAVITGLAVWSLVRPPVALVTRFNVIPPSGMETSGFGQLSPDGRLLAFQGASGVTSQVYLRRLGELEAVPVRGTEGTRPLGFSPDGEGLLVVDVEANGISSFNAAVKRVRLEGGPSLTIAEGNLSADWGPADTVVFGAAGSGLRLVRTSGGEPEQLTTLAEGETAHASPRFLPDGSAVLFHATTFVRATTQIAVYDLETGVRTNLLRGTSPQFTATGHLLFWRDGSLWAVPFEPDELVLSGDPVVVEEGVASTLWGGAYSLATNGTLVYLPAEAMSTSTLGWVSREGAMTQDLFEAPNLVFPRLSPDGTRVVFQRQAETGGVDLWVRDLEGGSEVRLTEASGFYPVWTPDSRTVTFTKASGRGAQLFSKAVDLTSPPELVRPTEGLSAPGSWTPDGQTLVYRAIDSQNDSDLWALTLGGEHEPFLDTEFNELAPQLSPNGRWVAYTSDATGEDQVYVQAFPKGGAVFSISEGMGTEAVWSRNGRELFYRNGDQLWAVDVETDPGFRMGSPRVLFEAPYVSGGAGSGISDYDVSRDGEQFLMMRRNVTDRTPAVTVVLNWFEELKRLAPTN